MHIPYSLFTYFFSILQNQYFLISLILFIISKIDDLQKYIMLFKYENYQN